MATPVPAGWRQRSTNTNEYEAILVQGQYKYEVNVDIQTGQRQVYTIDPIFQTRELLATVNPNGNVTRTDAYNNIASLPNGQTRIKEALDGSRTYANKIVGSVGTEAQKRSLVDQKEYAKLKSELPPTGPGSVATGQSNQDQTGPNSGAASGISTAGGGPVIAASPFRNVSNYEDEKNYGTWTYPKLMNKNQDHMIIFAYNYKVADVFAGSNGESNLNNSNILTGLVDISQRSYSQKEILGSVTLPIPSNVSEANQTKWGSDELSGLTAGLMGATVGGVSAAAGGDIKTLMSSVTSTAEQVFGKTAANSQIKQLLTLNAAASVVKKLGVSVNPESYRSRVTGTVINPNLELLFNGPALRSFQFQYKLAPRSQEEARQIRGIIKFFKKAMAPKRSNKSNVDSFFLGAPNVFKIKFKNGKNDSKTLPTLKTCALVNFNVNYTAEGFYSAFYDGQPVSVQIDMTFAELTPVYNDHYDFSDSVGFKSDIDELENPTIDYQEITELQANSDNNQNNTPKPPPTKGGASDPVAPATRVLQPGGSTATPGVDTPRQQPPFAGGLPPA